MGKIIKDTIHANGIDIGIYTQDFENKFISLTDIAKYKSDDPTAVIQNWMRNRDVIEFLGLWERLHNPDEKGNMRDMATINQLLILANLESYNAILINQGKTQEERMKLLRQLVLQQLQTLDSLSISNLPKLEM